MFGCVEGIWSCGPWFPRCGGAFSQTLMDSSNPITLFIFHSIDRSCLEREYRKEQMDPGRTAVESTVLPHCYDQVSFGALSLDNKA